MLNTMLSKWFCKENAIFILLSWEKEHLSFLFTLKLYVTPENRVQNQWADVRRRVKISPSVVSDHPNAADFLVADICTAILWSTQSPPPPLLDNDVYYCYTGVIIVTIIAICNKTSSNNSLRMLHIRRKIVFINRRCALLCFALQ